MKAALEGTEMVLSRLTCLPRTPTPNTLFFLGSRHLLVHEPLSMSSWNVTHKSSPRHNTNAYKQKFASGPQLFLQVEIVLE